MTATAARNNQETRMISQLNMATGGCCITVDNPGRLGAYSHTIEPSADEWKATTNTGDLIVTRFYPTRESAIMAFMLAAMPAPVLAG